MPKLRPFTFKALLYTTLIVLGGCSGSPVYEDTKGWGNDLWADIKKGSKQAATSTKEALSSATKSLEESISDANDDKSPEIATSKIEPSPVKTEIVTAPNGKTSTPVPLKAPEKAAQPPVPVSTKGSYAVHLSSNKSKKSAEQEWNELKNAFPKETQALQLRVKSVKITGKGTFYRVLGSAYPNKSLADEACKKFKSKKQYCMPVKL
ncbi:SPOR domain-containing protein [Kiloniella antarctica]|uniref:SPOR domain-containing protein n=1 Tax=Kiloniella antarctica TaxID=1550907 RepID=A0ABW5BS12_9PROT